MYNNLAQFESEAAYLAAKAAGQLPNPPYVATYPTSDGKSKIIYANVDGESQSEVIATAQLAAKIAEYQQRTEELIQSRMAVDMSNIDEDGKKKLNEVAMAGEVGKKIEERAKKDGYYAGMRVANSDALAPMGSNAPVYDEIITAGRMVNDAPDLMGSRTPSATNADSNIALRDMRGDVMGENQMQTNKTIVETPAGYATEENKTVLTNLSALSSWTRIFAHSKSYEPLVGHKYLVLFHTKTNFPSSEISARVLHWNQQSASVTQIIPTTIKEDGYVSCIINITKNVESGIGCISYNIFGYTGASDGIVEIYNNNACLDLTTYFPLPEGQSFVNSLTNNSASALAVAHRLGCFSYTRNGSVATQLEDETISLLAKTAAKLGFQEPKLCTGSVGRYHLIDGNTGSIKQTLDFRSQKTAAWTKLLAKLAEQGVDVSADWAQNPFEASSNANVGIIWDNKGVTVSGWVEDFGRLNWVAGDNGTFLTNGLSIKGIKQPSHSYQSNLLPIVSAKYITTKYVPSDMAEKTMDYYLGRIPDVGYSDFVLRIKDSAYTDATSFKTAMQGVLALYELDTPIRIDFDEEMNLNLVDVKPYDLYALDDMDGEPMYDIHIEQLESGEYKTTVAPSTAWIEQHHQLPVSIRSAIVGLGTQVNYDFVMNLYNEVQELKSRMQ